MKKIDFLGRAKKLRGNSYISYFLWVDGCGGLYIQACDNDKTGTFSELLFAVSQYAAVRKTVASIGHPIGYSLTANNWEISKNNNDGGFLKAVLRDLLPEFKTRANFL